MKKRVLPAVDEDGLSPKAKKQVHHLQAYSEGLIEEIHAFEDKVARLDDEVAILKGEKKRPIFKPSRMHEEAGQADHEAPAQGQQAKRPGSHKKSKTVQLKIDHDCIIEPTEPVPPGSRFKGYRDFTVQDIMITPNTTRYRLARWQTPDGRHLTGQLPKALQGCHFGPELASYMLYQRKR
jgi:hypothetical protein